MKLKRTDLLLAALLAVSACSSPPSHMPSPEPPPGGPAAPATSRLRDPREVHLGDVVQLTRGAGENAEAYWSFSGRDLIFQSTRPPHSCDQILRMPAAAPAEPTLVSTGKGRTTCAYFLPGDDQIIYASTHHKDPACPAPPDHSQGYVWGLFDYDIFRARADGSEPVKLTDSPGYDAEATVCPVDGSIIFTSVRDGDLELYRMDRDGKNVVRLTSTPGYDGGAFFSADCTQIVWRASRPTGSDLDDYKRLLGQNLVRPTKLEIYVARADGSEPRQVTYLDTASFAPYFFPDGKRIIFSSSYGSASPRQPEFDLWAIDVDGTDLERITFTPGFDGFPVFSPDGKRLAFGSNRNQKNPRETDVFVATWVDGKAAGRPGPAEQLAADIAWLADDAREGRGVGTDGLEAAAGWLEARFKEIGLAPAMADGYRQGLEVVVDLELGAGNQVTIDGAAVGGDQFVPASFSASGQAAGQTVYAGWGIVARELGVDDYRKVDVKGKIAVVRRFVPEGKPFDGDEAKRRYSDLWYKAFTARERGAIAMIAIDLPAPAPKQKGGGPKQDKQPPAPEPAPLPRLAPSLTAGDVGIPVVVLKQEAGAPLARGRHQVALRTALVHKKRTAHNIVGVLRAGAATRLPGAVVIGAHYDHLGLGGRDSLEPDVRAPHNGADDNASGTAALLQVARALVTRRAELRRDVWLVAFTAEESGVIGSTQFVRTPPPGLKLDQVVAMLNMDMVGRLRGNALSVQGGESAAEWSELVEPACAAARVSCALGGSGYGPSDHSPFYAAGVPVLQFFTGAHTDYHKTTDDADRINAAGAARVAAIVADVAAAAANREVRLTYKRTAAPLPAGDARSFGASLGTIPEYADSGPGVLLSGVRPGGPAEQAGVRRGDRIVGIGGTEIRTIQDMMFVLRQARPGQRTAIAVIRDGKRLELMTTYGPSMGR